MKMKKIIIMIVALSIFTAFFACKSTPENPNVGPEITVTIPELFEPDPNKPNEKFTISISVKHPAPIKDWEVQINRRAAGQARAAGDASQRPAGDRQPREGQEGEQRQRQRRVFFEQKGEKNPPKTLTWDGKGNNGEMVQSATDYRFDLTVTDIFDNTSTYEGLISVGVIVISDGENLRIVVPSIVFPGNSADLNSSAISDEDKTSNRRVLRLIANVLNKFEDYSITVEGHANPTAEPGTPAWTTEENRAVTGNKPLSEERAKSVIEALSSGDNATRKDRMTAVGMGTSRTVADWDDEDENWKNRRVEFILKK